MTTFSDILGGPREIDVRGLKVTYRPDAMTPNSLARLLSVVKNEDPLTTLEAYQHTLPAFVAAWDLVDNDMPVPLTPEGIGDVPLAILDLVFAAIMDDRAERASAEGNVSTASSTVPPPASTTPSSTENHPNGSATSPLPVSIVSGSGSS